MESGLAALLKELISKLVNALLPQELSSYLYGARLEPLVKKKGGIRPLAIGEVLKLVASKIVVSLHGTDVVEGLHLVGATPANGTLDAAVLTAQSRTAKARSSEGIYSRWIFPTLTIQLARGLPSWCTTSE